APTPSRAGSEANPTGKPTDRRMPRSAWSSSSRSRSRPHMAASSARPKLIGITAVCLGMSACAQQPATTQAQDVHTLYYVILALAAAVFIGVEGTLLWSVVRYRR